MNEPSMIRQLEEENEELRDEINLLAQEVMHYRRRIAELEEYKFMYESLQ